MPYYSIAKTFFNFAQIGCSVCLLQIGQNGFTFTILSLPLQTVMGVNRIRTFSLTTITTVLITLQ